MKFKKAFITIIFTGLFLLKPSLVFANIMCVDGTESPTCSYCHQGCCSHHGGCASRNYYNDYEEEDYEEDYENEYDDNLNDEDTYEDEEEYSGNNYTYEDDDTNDESDNGEALIPLLVAGGGLAATAIYSKNKR